MAISYRIYNLIYNYYLQGRPGYTREYIQNKIDLYYTWENKLVLLINKNWFGESRFFDKWEQIARIIAPGVYFKDTYEFTDYVYMIRGLEPVFWETLENNGLEHEVEAVRDI